MSTVLTQLFMQIRANLYEKLLKGELNYPSEMNILKKHLTLAEEAGDWFTVGRTYNLLGVITNYYGEFESAIAYHQAAYETHSKQNNLDYMALAQGNVGEIKRRRGLYADSILDYQAGLQTLADTPNTRVLNLLQNNLAWALLAQRDLAAAFPLLEAVYQRSKSPDENADAVLESLCGLAEVYLLNGDMDQAWSLARLALEQAEMSQYVYNIALAQWTLAHLSDPESPQQYELYVGLACQTLAGESLLRQSQVLLHEARYQKKSGNLERTAHFKRLAYQMLREFGLESEIELAESTFEE